MGERAKSQRGEMDSCSSDDESDVSATDNMKPTTLAFDINELLNDEEVADINLIPENNADDTQIRSVPAIKAILAARSKVFKRMLYGEFRETSQSNNDEGITTIRLDYSGRVFQHSTVQYSTVQYSTALHSTPPVQFATNTFLALIQGLHNSSEGRTASLTLEGKCRLLTNLSGAAHYFDIPKLELDIQDLLKNYMNEYPSLACAILDQSSQMLSGENLGFIAMDKIRARPKSALLQAKITTAPPGGCVSPVSFHPSTAVSTHSPTACGVRGGITALRASLLEHVIFDDQSNSTELTKFQCLKFWVDGCKHEVTLEDIQFPRKRLDTDDIEASRTPHFSSRKDLSSGSLTSVSSSEAPSPPPRVTGPSSPKQKEEDSSSADVQRERRIMVYLSTHDLYQAYRLQALNAERTKSKVFVEGAGLGEVNGTYVQRGSHEGTPMFRKEGVWRDKEETFCIFLCTYSNGNKSWCLSVVPKGKEPGKTSDIDFYECPVSFGKTAVSASGETVPSRGWKLVSYGSPPVPKCSLIAGCVDYGTKHHPMKNADVKLDIFDLSGDPDFVEVRKEFYDKTTDVVLLVYDVSDKASFEALPNFVDELRANGLSVDNTTIIIVGNKTDKTREVSEEDGLSASMQNRTSYREASAKTGASIEDLFDFALSKVCKGDDSLVVRK
ncbi:hypothetical protein THAOC_05829 [Thalassiosira oceanica]|uniref:BTB domain-containing protein n=1 Tax=Thalassiosira oceanica TaxID=159749 RepID=K0T1U7_THAOC|nr:hypothetical protein THAOC_05829 [Thalassiosira oceanica]|eukprot:EJK72623.1 hypothetical protein THAOC_05829 [Thalassiosira oceanica]